MDLVIDANIIFASLIKDSKTAELLLNKNFTLYMPEFFIKEFIKYADIISIKTHRNLEEFYDFVNNLLRILIAIPNSETEEFIEEARRISPDENDADYFALALKLNCPIWSNDKKIKEQDIIKVYSTSELIEYLNSE